MTVTTPPPTGEQPPRRHDVALWAGLSAFFGSVLAIGAIDIFDPSDAVQFLGSLVVAGITAGGVYSKQRLDDAKRLRDDSAKFPL